MTISRRLAAHRAAVASASAAMPDDEHEIPNPDAPGEDEDDDETEAQAPMKKEKPMTTEIDQAAALAAAKGEGFAEANARATAVLTSAEYAGRESLAATLLGNAKLDGAEIVAALASAPKIEASTLNLEADDVKARADMRASLAAEQPGSTADAGDVTVSEGEANSANWGSAFAQANELAGFKA